MAQRYYGGNLQISNHENEAMHQINPITAVASLKACTKLKDLHQINPITAVASLKACTKLKDLHQINPITAVASLKACTKLKDLHKGIRLYGDIVRFGFLQKNSCVGNTVVDMFAKCGALAKAKEIFDMLPSQTVTSWNVLIGGYVHHGFMEEALESFELMQSKELSPNPVTFLSIVKACASLGSAVMGEQIHDKVVRDCFPGVGVEVVMGSALTDMYCKCGSLENAQEVFDKVQVRNVVLWNALISGYVQHGHGVEALNHYERMCGEGLIPDAITYTSALKACGSMGATLRGQQFHTQSGIGNMLETDIVLANALIDMYACSGCLGKARDVFAKLSIRDTVSWNVLIQGYVQHGHCKEALDCIEQMKSGGLSPDPITIACILKACGSMGNAEKGEELYTEHAKDVLSGNGFVVDNALIDMYCKCGMLEKARKVLLELPFRDVVSWNTLISGYIQHGYFQNALDCFEWMQMEGVAPNGVTTLSILRAAGITRDAMKCLEIHGYIARKGLAEKDVLVGTALVEMYGRSSMLVEAQQVFESLLVRDVVSWNALLTGYVQHAQSDEAFRCFEQSQGDGIVPNVATFVCILKVCGSTGSAHNGQDIHAEVMRGGSFRKDLVVGTALVDMYSCCGMLVGAQEVFNELTVRDVVLWNALISGYARMGENETVYILFDRMVEEDNQQPNAATFTILLNTCCHTGLLDEAQLCFEMMRTCYDMIPNIEHHTCMIDLFCRAGQLNKAVALIKEMPSCADLTVWHTVLGACQTSGNLKLGRLAFEHAEQLDEECVATHVYRRNIYAAYCGPTRQEFSNASYRWGEASDDFVKAWPL